MYMAISSVGVALELCVFGGYASSCALLYLFALIWLGCLSCSPCSRPWRPVVDQRAHHWHRRSPCLQKTPLVRRSRFPRPRLSESSRRPLPTVRFWRRSVSARGSSL